MKYLLSAVLSAFISVACVACANGSSGSGAQQAGGSLKAPETASKVPETAPKDDSVEKPLTRAQEEGLASLKINDETVAIFRYFGQACGCMNSTSISCSGKTITAPRCAYGTACCY